MSDLPEGWRSATVKDLFSCWGGMTPSTAQAGYWSGTIPWLSSKDIKAWRIDCGTEFVTQRALAETRLRKCRPGTVIVVVRSGVLAHTLPVALTSREVVVNQDLKALDSGDDRLNEWLAYYLWAHERKILEANRKDGTTVQSIRVEELLERELPIPPLAEQRRIVEKVEALLADVNKARDRLAGMPLTLKRFRRSVLASACSGDISATWRATHVATRADEMLRELAEERRQRWDKEQSTRMSRGRKHYKPAEGVDEADELPGLPPGWTWASLDAITAKIVDGVHKTPAYVHSGVPFVTVRNLTRGRGIDFTQLSYITQSDHQRFVDRANPQRGDLLITKDGTLGVVRAIRTDLQFSIFVSVALLKPVITELTDYLELALSSPQVQQRLVPTGSGLQHLHLRDLKTVAIPLPPLDEQRDIVRRVRQLFSVADSIESLVSTATFRASQLPHAILAKAFSGELVPTEAELARAEGRDYETAEDLLKRVAGAAAPSTKARRGRKTG